MSSSLLLLNHFPPLNPGASEFTLENNTASLSYCHNLPTPNSSGFGERGLDLHRQGDGLGSAILLKLHIQALSPKRALPTHRCPPATAWANENQKGGERTALWPNHAFLRPFLMTTGTPDSPGATLPAAWLPAPGLAQRSPPPCARGSPTACTGSRLEDGSPRSLRESPQLRPDGHSWPRGTRVPRSLQVRDVHERPSSEGDKEGVTDATPRVALTQSSSYEHSLQGRSRTLPPAHVRALGTGRLRRTRRAV